MIKSAHIGKLGEELACLFLMKHGYNILDRNYLRKWGELDIVASFNKITVFIEVKSVSCKTLDNVLHETSNDTHRPEDNVHKNKQDRLKRVIQTYLIDKRLEDREWIFSVITVFIQESSKKAKIEHLEDVVL